MYNRAVVMGRLTADPELRQTQSGLAVTSFSIAVDRRFSNRQTGERETDFLEIVAWRQTAEFICRYFQKGNPILIEGTIQTRQFTDKNNQNRRVWEIVADNAFFTGSKSEGGGGGAMSAPPQAARRQEAPAMPAPAYASGSIDDFAEIEDDDDLPF